MKHNLLFVEDNKALLSTYCEYFSQHHYRVKGVDNWQDAQKSLVQRLYSLVVTDIRLEPGESNGGVKVIEWVRSSRPGTPVLVLTAVTDADLSRELRALGAYDILTKPIPLAELELIVRNTLRNSITITGRTSQRLP